MTTIEEAAFLRKEDEFDAQETSASREEFGSVPDVPLAGDYDDPAFGNRTTAPEWDEDAGKNEPCGDEGYDPRDDDR